MLCELFILRNQSNGDIWSTHIMPIAPHRDRHYYHCQAILAYMYRSIVYPSVHEISFRKITEKLGTLLHRLASVYSHLGHDVVTTHGNALVVSKSEIPI